MSQKRIRSTAMPQTFATPPLLSAWASSQVESQGEPSTRAFGNRAKEVAHRSGRVTKRVTWPSTGMSRSRKNRRLWPQGAGPAAPVPAPRTPHLLPSALFRFRNAGRRQKVSPGNSGFGGALTITVDRDRRPPLSSALPLRNGVELSGDRTRLGIGVVLLKRWGSLAVERPPGTLLRFGGSERADEDSFQGWALPGVPDDETSAATSLRGQRGSPLPLPPQSQARRPGREMTA